jgi:hypothetical protein
VNNSLVKIIKYILNALVVLVITVPVIVASTVYFDHIDRQALFTYSSIHQNYKDTKIHVNYYSDLTSDQFRINIHEIKYKHKLAPLDNFTARNISVDVKYESAANYKIVKITPYLFDPKIGIPIPYPKEDSFFINMATIKDHLKTINRAGSVKCRDISLFLFECSAANKANEEAKLSKEKLMFSVDEMTRKHITYLTKATGDKSYLRKWNSIYYPKLPSRSTMKRISDQHLKEQLKPKLDDILNTVVQRTPKFNPLFLPSDIIDKTKIFNRLFKEIKITKGEFYIIFDSRNILSLPILLLMLVITILTSYLYLKMMYNVNFKKSLL